jgi:RNA polymerase sigma-70 factor, ECF subfamily
MHARVMNPELAAAPSVDALAEEHVAVLDAQAGDAPAFARLYRSFGPMVHAIALVHVPAVEVDDVVQEAFAAAWSRLGELREPSAFGGWLARIARHRAIDRQRRRRPVESLAAEPVMVGPSAMDRAEARAALEAIRSLPEAYRETLAMRLCEGMTGPEIALRTGQTPGSVRVNLCRGMKLLRAKLGGTSDER